MSRLRDIGIEIGSFPAGPLNAITDVDGVKVGHATIIEGDGPLVVGHGPIRTGVTVVRPREGSARETPLFAGTFALNGNGEMTGTEFIRETGLLTTDIGLTNTHSVGAVRDALAAAELSHQRHLSSNRDLSPTQTYWSIPVVAETYDGRLNDIDGHHVTALHVDQALRSAASGPVLEGAIGGGTGMVCYGFKGGIGTSSRVIEHGAWTVGVLVQANHGRREDLIVSGMPVGRQISPSELPDARIGSIPSGAGSIIIIVATDAPLLPDQCRRLARSAATGLSRAGGGTSDDSGDMMLAFSTGNTGIPGEYYSDQTPTTYSITVVTHQQLSPLLRAASDATEEAIINALLAAETMVGRDGVTAHGLDADRLRLAFDSTPRRP